jgi:hypothetical protein
MPTVQLRTPAGDVNVVDESLVDYYRQQGWTEEPTAAQLAAVAAEAEAQQLKGAALDAALEEAGLSKAGSADEKRQRLAEHNTPAAEAPAEAPITTEEQ